MLCYRFIPYLWGALANNLGSCPVAGLIVWLVAAAVIVFAFTLTGGNAARDNKPGVNT